MQQEKDKVFIARRIKAIAREKDISMYRLEKESGLSRSTITTATNERDPKMPGMYTINAILKTLDVPHSDFFRDEFERCDLSNDEEQLIENFRKCSVSGRLQIQAYAEGILAASKPEKGHKG